MRDWPRSIVVLGSAFTAVVAATLALAFAIVGEPATSISQQRNGVPSAAPSASEAGEPSTASGVGGVLTITGDRTERLALDREVTDGPIYALAGPDGQVGFEGQPATVSRIQVQGLSFYLDPGDCEHTAGERDDSTGLAPLEVSCGEIKDVRDTAVLTVEGTLTIPAEQLGLRGSLPPTGGEVTVGDETLTFDAAALDLQRPEIIETRPGFTTRNPVVYPVSVPGPDGTLQFEFDVNASDLRLVGLELSEGPGQVGDDGCELQFRELGQLSPRVTVVELTLDCAAVEMDGMGSLPLEGSIVIDIAEFPQ